MSWTIVNRHNRFSNAEDAMTKSKTMSNWAVGWIKITGNDNGNF